MIFQNAGNEIIGRLNTRKLMEWESPKSIDGFGGTTGERRL